MRNVACVGAAPRALSDCLNFGSPEDPEVFHDFEETLRGIGDAAARIWQFCGPEAPGRCGEPVPIVTGNVSFYNQTASGRAVAASPIVACYGVMEDWSKAVTMGLKQAGSVLLLIGRRYDELGGSLYYERVTGGLGRSVPIVRYEAERAAVHLVIGAIGRGLVEACHDISSGGLVMTLAEMCMASRDALGAGIDVTAIAGTCGVRAGAKARPGAGGAGFDIRALAGEAGSSPSCSDGLTHDRKLFSESPGFVLEVAPLNLDEFLGLAERMRVKVMRLGAVSGEPVMRASDRGRMVLEVRVRDMMARWKHGLDRALA
jgi:phosphoribosylformylglycinamidine synthase